MSDETLGIDLGTNSLGWAILDNITGDIKDRGVLIFPEGIDPNNDTLETPAALRRAARMGRRMKFRRKIRKWILLKILIENKMTPLTEEELARWRKEGVFPLNNKAYIEWLHSSDLSNPYADRAAAASGKVDPMVLGRALYHLAQRRGFKSSRKDADAQGEETDKDSGKVKGDIARLTDEIAAAGCKTLGQYFHKILESNKSKIEKTRIRKRYTGRIEHYETEFAAIMDAQGLKPSDELRESLHKAIFYQRPLRSQKHLVGSCPLEQDHLRCRIAHPAFEEFRTLAFVNNLRLVQTNGEGEKLPLPKEYRPAVLDCFCRKSNFKFGTIMKKLGKELKKTGMEFYYHTAEEVMTANTVSCSLKEVFGERKYDAQTLFDALVFFDDDAKLRDWVMKHFNKEANEGIDKEIRPRLLVDGDLTEEECDKLAKIKIKDGYAKYSLKAINKILPFLRMGRNLRHALLLAKLPDLMENWARDGEAVMRRLDEIGFEYRQEKERYEGHKLPDDFINLSDREENCLRFEFGVDDAMWSKLYTNCESKYIGQKTYKNGKGEIVEPVTPRIPEVKLGMIRNPLVQRSMTMLRRLVNHLSGLGKIDKKTTIRIELARGVNNLAKRNAIKKWNIERAKFREEAREEIAKLSIKPTEEAIDRYVLWKEQDGKCLYTGRQIRITQLFNGNEFDIEHTIPRSLSGDDSLANKTICDAVYNRQVKRGQVPSQCPNFNEVSAQWGSAIKVNLKPWEEKVELLKAAYQKQRGRAKGCVDAVSHNKAQEKANLIELELDYWRDKLNRFLVKPEKLSSEEGKLNGFKRRQLVDAGIMSAHAVELLESVYNDVQAVNGAATAFARKAWGLQGDEAKDRTNHTHHAKDAMVIAALTPSRFNAICSALKDDGTIHPRPCDVCPAPYENFAEKVRKAAEDILVKHVLRQTTLKQSSKRNVLAKSHVNSKDPSKVVSAVLSRGDTVRGQLHKETFYGCIMKPGSEDKAFVVRKSLIGPVKNAKALIDKIVDPAINAIVADAIARLEQSGKTNVEPGDIRMSSGVPVNKVRIYAHKDSCNELRNHTMPSTKPYKNPYYVESGTGSNFRLAIFDNPPDAKLDNSLYWAQNHKKADYMPCNKKPGFVGYVYPGTMAFTHDGDKRGHLYKVVKFNYIGKYPYITLRLHSEARAAKDLEKELPAIGKNKKGESKIDFENPHEMLLIGPKVYLKQIWFEGIHFDIGLDGVVRFKQSIK